MSSNEDSDNDASQATTSSGKRKKELSVKFKLQVVEWAKLNRNNNGKMNKRATAKHFGVSPKNVRRWIAQAGQLEVRKARKGGNLAKNLPGAGRPIKDKDFELELNDWVSEGRAGKYKVTRDLIVARAKQLQEKIPKDRRVKLSHGWLEKFMTRNKWTLRAPTSVAQKNAPFKRKLRSLYEAWMLEGDRQTTAAGNPRPPPPEVYLQWVLDAWDSLKTDVIIRSFQACGISTKLDGSEDALIHCLKEGNGMHDGVASLVKARQEAHALDLPELMQGLEVEAPEDPEEKMTRTTGATSPSSAPESRTSRRAMTKNTQE